MGGNESKNLMYQGNSPGLSVSLMYPTTWTVSEEQGKMEAYRQVRIRGPRNRDDTYTASFSVRASPTRQNGGKYQNVKELVNFYTSHLFKDATIIAQQHKEIAHLPAQDLTVTYTIPALHQPGLKAIAIPVKTRTVFLEKAPYLYEIIYSADAREYELYASAFEQLLNTFQFR